ncbi:MAG: hypothetical protein ABSC77_13230 [Terracidiphilus sp.]
MLPRWRVAVFLPGLAALGPAWALLALSPGALPVNTAPGPAPDNQPMA